MRRIVKGSTDISVDVYIIDSTDGTPELGVLFSATGIDLEYRREGQIAVNITEVTLAALTTAHADGGFLEIGHGLYRLDVPDAAFAGAETVSIQGTVTGMIVLPQTIQLVNGVVVAGTDGIPSVNTTYVDGDLDAAKQLRDNLDTTERFVVDNTFTPTTTQVQPDAVFFGDTAGTLEATDNHYNDKTIVGLTGVNQGISKLITGYDGTNKRFTFDAMPAAFGNNDEFIVI